MSEDESEPLLEDEESALQPVQERAATMVASGRKENFSVFMMPFAGVAIHPDTGGARASELIC